MTTRAPDLLELRDVDRDLLDGFLTHTTSISPLIANCKGENNTIYTVSLTFGQKLKLWREAARLTQVQLAKAAQLSVPYVSNLERDFASNTRSGRPRASLAVADRLAQALNVPKDEVRHAAGHASEHPITKPQTVNELLHVLNELGVSAQFLGGVESYPDDPDLLQDILDDFATVLALRFRRKKPNDPTSGTGLLPG
jgi:transcriptional regulator with XRE-family HTH domain